MNREKEAGLTQKFLNEIFEYEIGILFWRKITKGCNAKVAGDIAGSLSHNYWRIQVNNQQYKAHRIIWIMFNGDIPEGLTIDHKDRDTLNNCIDNLRVATAIDQQANRPARNDSKTNVRGVCWHKQSRKWRAQVNINGCRTTLGSFKDLEEAKTCYDNFMLTAHPEFYEVQDG